MGKKLIVTAITNLPILTFLALLFNWPLAVYMWGVHYMQFEWPEIALWKDIFWTIIILQAPITPWIYLYLIYKDENDG